MKAFPCSLIGCAAPLSSPNPSELSVAVSRRHVPTGNVQPTFTRIFPPVRLTFSFQLHFRRSELFVYVGYPHRRFEIDPETDRHRRMDETRKGAFMRDCGRLKLEHTHTQQRTGTHQFAVLSYCVTASYVRNNFGFQIVCVRFKPYLNPPPQMKNIFPLSSTVLS